MDDPGCLMAVPDPQGAKALPCASPKTRFLADHCGGRGVPLKAVVHDLSGFWRDLSQRVSARGFAEPRRDLSPRPALGATRRTLRPGALRRFLAAQLPQAGLRTAAHA